MEQTTTATIKVIGANGQISLGEEFAGRQVLVEEQEPGVWHIRTASVIPDNEQWLHEPQSSQRLQAALAWSQTNPPDDSNVDEILKRLRDAG